MDNLAYLHLAGVYEDPSASELVYLSSWLKTAQTPDLKRFSSKAWRYMLPLVLTISILSIASSALALQKGDRGPSVKNLQQDLKRAGFYQAPVTQVYDIKTEDAVKRFQKAASIGVDGIAGPATLQKLEGWRAAVTVNTNSNRTNSNRAVATKKPVAKTAPNNGQKPLVRVAANTTKRRNPNLLAKGDEGEAVKALQERLRVAGFYYGNSTGIYGPITEDAVKRFQRAYGLDVDGIVGAQTLTKLPPIGVGFGEEAPKSMTIAATRRNKEFLGLGDRGEPVRILQAQLIKAGYLKGQPNAYFGPYTADAVKRFQEANYLQASGIAGPTTRGKLYRNVYDDANKAEFNVLEIQRRLQARGFYKGPLNGEMSKDTKKAIKQAQEFYGVSLKDVRNGRF